MPFIKSGLDKAATTYGNSEGATNDQVRDDLMNLSAELSDAREQIAPDADYLRIIENEIIICFCDDFLSALDVIRRRSVSDAAISEKRQK